MQFRYFPSHCFSSQLFARIICLVFLGTCGLNGSVVLGQESVIDFDRDVAPIFAENCLSCHNEEEQKAGFSIETSELIMDYLEPGDLESSSLWTDYLRADPDEEYSLLMPPKAKGGPLSATSLAILGLWIQEGAVWPEGSRVQEAGAEVVAEKVVEPEKVETTWISRIWAFQGYFHPATVHFPIGMLLISAAAVLLSFVTGKRAEDFGYYSLLIGAFFAVIAAAQGWAFAYEQGYGSWKSIPSANDDMTLFWHRWLGLTVAVLSSVAAVFAFLARRRPKSSVRHIWRPAVLGIALLTAWVGHQGGELKWGEQLYHDAFDRLMGK